MSDEFHVERGESVVVGRRDIGWGVAGTLVTIAGEPFAEVRFKAGPAYFTPCGYCPNFSGTKVEYMHRHAGQCYQCLGRGWHKRYESVADVVRLAKRRKSDRARRERKEAERLAEQDAAHDVWKAENPEVATALATVYASLPDGDPGRMDYDQYAEFERAQKAADRRWGQFLIELAQQAHCRPLTDKQTAAVMPAVARADARHAEDVAKADASRYADGVEGETVTVTGVVTVTMVYDGDFGSRKMMVVTGTGDDEGVTVKTVGTGKTLWEVGKGDTVEITGAIKDKTMYQETRQTVLTRAKVKVLLAAAPE